jgi:hypothetical protein
VTDDIWRKIGAIRVGSAEGKGVDRNEAQPLIDALLRKLKKEARRG